jgi:hypothetical protein
VSGKPKIGLTRRPELNLADKYPHNSLAAHILDCVAQFLPALLCPGTRRGRVRHIVSNAKRLILPYLTGSFHPSFIEEYAGGLLMALQKQDGGIRPILCGEVWRRCFARLAVNATPIRNEAAKFFTSSYDNFIQTAGIRDGASHCAKVLSVLYDSLEYQIRMILRS